MNLLYRDANFEDEEQLQDLALIAYGQYKERMTEENWGRLRTTLTSENLFSDLLKKARSFICESNRKVVGMAFLVRRGNPTEVFQEDWSYLRMVGVHPKFSGSGIGKQLTKQCLDFALQSGEKTIALHTSDAMVAARHIYEKFGFKLVKELPLHYGMKYWLYKLEL